MYLLKYFLFIVCVRAFINKYNYIRSFRLNSLNSLKMPKKESVHIDKYRLFIDYKLTYDQVILIQNKINYHDRFIFYPIDNKYIIRLNLFISMLNNTIKYNSYLSILVKDKYINIYGEYILDRLEPIIYQMNNKTNPFYYFYSYESFISIYIDDTNDINNKIINNKHNISFIFDNITNNINYISLDLSNKNRYIINTSYISKLIYLNMTFHNAINIFYIRDDYNYDLFR